MGILQYDMKEIVDGVLKLLKDGAKEIFCELKNVLMAVLDTMKTIEDRRKYVNDVFNFSKIIATLGGMKKIDENFTPLLEDAMRVADGTWEDYHELQMERRKLKQESTPKRKLGR